MKTSQPIESDFNMFIREAIKCKSTRMALDKNI